MKVVERLLKLFTFGDAKPKTELRRGSCFTDWTHLYTYDLRDKNTLLYTNTL